MDNTLSEPTRPTRFNTNRVEISKDQKGPQKAVSETSTQLTNSGFNSNQIESVLDKIEGNQLQRPWDHGEGSKPSFESASGPCIDLKPMVNLQPAIALKPVIDSLIEPITNLNGFSKPGTTKPANPFPDCPFPAKPVGPQLCPQPEVELADPGLTDTHAATIDDENPFNDVTYQDIDGEIFIDSVGNDGVRAELTDIDQGKLANCYFLAVLGSIALHNPDYIENMITDNGNGTYTVSFGGELGDVTVDDDFATLANGDIAYAQMGDKSNPELWVAIIEKAYVQANRNTENGSVRDGTYQGIGFGSSSIAMENITGQSSTTAEPSAFTPESLQAALNNGQSVVMGTLGEDDKKTQTPDGLWRSHVYVLTDVRLNSKGQWEVTIYNPHGRDHHGAQQDPYTVLTMEQFNTNFRSVVMSDEPVG